MAEGGNNIFAAATLPPGTCTIEAEKVLRAKPPMIRRSRTTIQVFPAVEEQKVRLTLTL